MGSVEDRRNAPAVGSAAVAGAAAPRASASSATSSDLTAVQHEPSHAGGLLHGVFERQADLTPSAVALECGDRTWTYADVDAEANRLAHALRAKGIMRGSLIGLSLDRSEWPIIAILAILKAGAAYVPMDPTLPDDRLGYIAEAGGLTAILAEATFAARLAGLTKAPILTLQTLSDAASGQPADRLSLSQTGAEPADVCYVLFTSGTTGRPKGVVAEHRNVVHFVDAFNSVCSTTAADRVFQGFSLGFDGSVEEIWMAFSNGAALICGDRTTPKFGPELAQLLERTGITFLSTVPTMLSTLPTGLPQLRQLVVSGEACHPDIVARWAVPGRTMLNVYGPTETTVNTTSKILRVGEQVTIGWPLPGYEIYILDADMREVKPGEKGELYIGGPGVSRGYLNQPDLTARAYVEWRPYPDAEPLRLYRSGDLVRQTDAGEIEFFGRIDSQVKIRGFRVELGEIEAVLLERPQIASAAVKLVKQDDLESLAAYVVLADGAAELDRNAVLATLRARLPTYMVPSHLDVLAAFPMLVSGKVDRNRLPDPKEPLVGELGSADVPASELQVRIATVWEQCLRVRPIGLDQDFFLDLGGHSLLAAQVVTALRAATGIVVPVRALYANPTVRSLAASLGDSALAHDSSTLNQTLRDTVLAAVAPRRPWTTVAIQTLYLLAIIPLLSLPLVLILPTAVTAFYRQTSALAFAGLTAGVLAGTWLVLIVVAISAKWLLIGRFRPGRHPLWGGFYVRWWIASRLQHLANIHVFNGTPLAPVIWRLFGAKVGRACTLNPSLVYAWDCIRIGDDVSIGADTHMPALRIEDGEIVVAEITIGDRCFVGSHSYLGLNVHMEPDSRLDDQSLLADGDIVPAGAGYRGSPAVASDVILPEGAPLRCARSWLFVFTLLQLVCGAAVSVVTLAPVLAAGWVTTQLVLWTSWRIWLPAFLLIVPVTMFAFAVWSAYVKQLVHPRPEPGVHQVYSLKYLEHWLSSVIIAIIKSIGLPVFTTVYLPSWMRLLGARLGRHTEMSTVWSIDPDMVVAGDGVFFADGCMIGGRRTHLGRYEVARNYIGDRSFVGNSAILSTGLGIGKDCLLGVLSTTPRSNTWIEDGSDWLGSPGFRLPNRDKVTAFDPRLTYEPKAGLYLQRALIDAVRVCLPGYVLGGIGITSLLIVLWVFDHYGVWGAHAVVPLLFWLGMVVCIAVVVGVKRLLIGRYRPVVVPLWSRYVWFNELINGLYESLLAPIVTNLFGTPYAPVLMRLMGCRIGRYCYVETTLFSEFDLVEIGDHVALNAGAVLQNHLFEDRVMKSSYMDIGRGCTVGNMSIVLYDTVMEKGAWLGPLSLLMKGEQMPFAARWHGVPTVPV